jgi:hypothetical protein
MAFILNSPTLCSEVCCELHFSATPHATNPDEPTCVWSQGPFMSMAPYDMHSLHTCMCFAHVQMEPRTRICKTAHAFVYSHNTHIERSPAMGLVQIVVQQLSSVLQPHSAATHASLCLFSVEKVCDWISEHVACSQRTEGWTLSGPYINGLELWRRAV